MRPKGHPLEGVVLGSLTAVIIITAYQILWPWAVWPTASYAQRVAVLLQVPLYPFECFAAAIGAGAHVHGMLGVKSSLRWGPGEWAAVMSRIKVGAMLAAIPALAAGYHVGKAPDAIQHVRGRRLTTSPRLLSERGTTHIHPSITISPERERTHILLIGSTGAGKSQVIWRLLDDVLSRVK